MFNFNNNSSLGIIPSLPSINDVLVSYVLMCQSDAAKDLMSVPKKMLGLIYGARLPIFYFFCLHLTPKSEKKRKRELFLLQTKTPALTSA